ncbi:MAG: hypothetical protein JKY56_18970 [Kofleriaceae bacterium]|nr:hypothetical protein [Kofleriaceae bacterium]
MRHLLTLSIATLSSVLFLGCGSDSNPASIDAGAGIDATVIVDASLPPDAAPDASICMGDNDCETGRCQSDGSCSCPMTADIPPVFPWQRQVGAPLLVPGQVHGDGTNFLIADPSALYNEAEGKWQVWYAASRGECFTCENSAVIELAESSDGIAWTVAEDVALNLSGTGWDAIRSETPDVIVDPNAIPSRRYAMAYSGADVMLPLGFPNYNIGIAFSPDGKNFTRVSAAESGQAEDGLVLTELVAFPNNMQVNGGVVADPTLALIDGTYHMWFSSFGCADGDTCANILEFGISHATSIDAVHWIPDTANPVIVGGEQPSAIWNPNDCRFEMWMTRKAQGDDDGIPATFNPTLGSFRAVSEDGSSWTVESQRDFTWDNQAGGEQLGLLTGVDVALRGLERVLFYVGMGTDSVPPGFFIPVQQSFDKAGFVPGTFGLGMARQAVSSSSE